MLAQSMVEYGVLDAIAEGVRTATYEISSLVSSFISQELLVIGGAVLMGLLGYRLIWRPR